MKNYSEIKALDFEQTDSGQLARLIQKNEKKTSLSKGELTCVVMVANEIDAHGDFFTVECVKSAYEDYVNSYNQSSKSHGTQHTGNEVDAQLLSHWFTESGGVFDGVDAPANSFIAKFKINEEEVKQQYESGNFTGVSIEAKATVVPFSYLQEKGYTINDCMTLTKSKTKSSKYEVPKRVILKTKINKIDFVDAGANLRVGIYKSLDTEQNDENLELEVKYDIINEILEDELTPSLEFSVAKNLKLKQKRSELFGIESDINSPFYIEGIEKYDLNYYLDPVNLKHNVQSIEQMTKSLELFKNNTLYKDKDITVMQQRLTKILLEHDYDISYDYIKENLKGYFDEQFLEQIESKYQKEESVEKMEITKEFLEAVRAAVREVVTEKAAEKAEQETKEKAIKEQEEHANLEKQEKEKLKTRIKELEAVIQDLSKKESPVVDTEPKTEDLQVQIAKAVDAQLETFVSRLNASSTNSEFKKSEKKTGGSALDNFFDSSK